MKKLYLCAIAFLLFWGMNDAHSQGIYQHWGVTGLGGSDNEEGTLFSARFDGTGITTRKAFEIYTHEPGVSPAAFQQVNGKVYGFFDNAGSYEKGILYEFDPVAGTYTKKLDLHHLSLLYDTEFSYVYNNKLYGVADLQGGARIFEYDPVANTFLFKSLVDRTLTDFTWYSNKLYGAAYLGGANDKGYIFTLDPNTYTVTKLLDVPAWSGSLDGFLVYNNRLYGVGRSAGINSEGALVEYNPATNQLTEKASLGSAGGRDAIMPLRLYNGKIYGTTSNDLSFGGDGVLFSFDPALNQISKIMDLTDFNPMGSLAVSYNNKFYGVSSSGGNFNKGILYEFDPSINAYTKKIHFNGLPGEEPYPLLTLINGKMYGITNHGGKYKSGTIFEYNAVDNSIINKVDLGYSNGYRPYGKLVYYQGKLYGFTTKGGNHNKGVIYAYDLATHMYQIRHHMNAAMGYGNLEGSLILYNNKLYGVTAVNEGGRGVLFEFNPATNMYTVKHQFTEATGAHPRARPLIYNNKFYGTTLYGGNSDNGVLYEYDPVANTYAVRVHFGGSFGTSAIATLCAYNNKLYGTCASGGTFDQGTLFEYNPAFNGISIKYNFSESSGYLPTSGMTVLNDKLYGTADFGDGETFFGSLYEFDPASGAVMIKRKFTFPEGSLPRNEMITFNNKLYGLTAGGGTISHGGVLFEYDPVPNKWSPKSTFNFDNGRFPTYTALTQMPALVAPGTPGTCAAAIPAVINTTNANEWVPFTDKEGNAVMEINANGNILGSVRVEFYTHNGETRKDDANRFYLNRNITVTVENQPAIPVNVRLYIRKTEFDALKNTAGSGVQTVSDITIFKNDDHCTDNVKKNALPLSSAVSVWGLDYVYTTQVSSFSSFYFASKAYTALPIKLEYFKGNAEAVVNKLQWKASCTDNADFVVERSANGAEFSEIGLVLATAADCDLPFSFPDQQPFAGKSFYRIKMKDEKGVITYSNIISIDRSNTLQLTIQLNPNPVEGGVARFSIQSPFNGTIPVSVYDATGRLIVQTNFAISKGSQYKEVDLGNAPPGMYIAVFTGKEGGQPVRFLRK